MNEHIIKYFQGELNAVERLQFLRQVETDEELKKQFIEYKNMHALLHLSNMSGTKENADGKYAMLKKAILVKHTRKFLLYTVGYAAVAALLIVSTYLFFYSHFENRSSMANAENVLYVPAGQRVQLTLQDGTEVWLNSQTRLTYPASFSGKARRVSVEGEAFFDVAKNPDMPFIVSSHGVEMKVLGTKFNVCSYPGKGSIKTSLLEGGLKVYFPNEESKGIVLKPEEQVTIEGNSMKVGTMPPADYFLWKDGIYSFVNEPLIDILKKLELYYDVKINVEDESIYNSKYTGKFRQRDGIDEILHMIQRIHKFKITKDGENNIFTLKR